MLGYMHHTTAYDNMVATLQSIIIHKLSEQSHTGYSLCKEIEHSTGKKPSFGSIYPILERFKQQNYVTVTRKGRKKIYTLTTAGKRAAEEQKQHQTAMINSLIAQSKVFGEITGCNPEQMIAMLEKFKRGEDPLLPVSQSIFKLRDTMFQLAQQKKIVRHEKEINTILLNAKKQLETLL